jgi:hypothetical protein
LLCRGVFRQPIRRVGDADAGLDTAHESGDRPDTDIVGAAYRLRLDDDVDAATFRDGDLRSPRRGVGNAIEDDRRAEANRERYRRRREDVRPRVRGVGEGDIADGDEAELTLIVIDLVGKLGQRVTLGEAVKATLGDQLLRRLKIRLSD